MSTLSREYSRDAWTLDIQIYEDGTGKWLLEAVDERGTSTCWTDPFDAEQLAFDEALRTIKEEGIAAFSESLPYRDE